MVWVRAMVSIATDAIFEELEVEDVRCRLSDGEEVEERVIPWS